MHKMIDADLTDAVDALEHLIKRLHKQPLETKVDVGARIRGLAKSIEVVDKEIKDEVKEILKQKEGEVTGELFKAILKLVPTTRLDQKLLKAEHPEVYQACLDETEVLRVTYEPR